MSVDLMNSNTHLLSQEGDWLVCERKEESRSETILPTWKHSLERPEYYKIGRFYINDLHNAEKVDDNFIFKKMPFLYVYFTGIIISNSTHKEKLCLEVHDGTNSIICMIEESFLNLIKQQKIKYAQDCDPSVEGDKSTAVFQAALITNWATNYLAKHVPTKPAINLGDIVNICGKLGEHNGKRYIFVNKISFGAVTDLCDNIEYLLNMYMNEYEILK